MNKTFFVEVMQDVDGSFSSKRLITFIFTVLMVAMVIANTWFGQPVDHTLFESVRDIVVAGLGFIGAEKFTHRNEDPPAQ